MRVPTILLAVSCLLCGCPNPSRPDGDAGSDDGPCNVTSDCAPKHYCGVGVCVFDCRIDADCGDGRGCDGFGRCVALNDAGEAVDAGPDCSGQACEQGAIECVGDAVRRCVDDGRGCGVWAALASCGAGETCGVSGCEPLPCAAGQKRCGPGGVEACGPGDVFVMEKACVQGCGEGECVTQVSCEAGVRRCVSIGSGVQQTCSDDGRAWLFERRCGAGCAASGRCAGACDEGESTCDGDRRQVCVSGAFSTQEVCARGCKRGACLLTDTEIAGSDVRLSGVVEVDGDVRIVSGGRLLVESNEGLTLRAKSISMDSTGSIVARATGVEVAGAGKNGSICTSATTVVSGGGGGGYGVKGVDSERVATGCFPKGAGGVVFGSDKDARVSAGGAGGAGAGGASAKGGAGGGVIRLEAPVIELDGTVRADGERGANGAAVGGGGGGGSGGGILIAGNVVRISAGAVVSAKGGTAGTGGYIGGAGAGSANGGDGGDGRVKVLAGTERTVAGTITGVKTESVLPPVELVSSTHPDEGAWWNDGGRGLDVAWRLPFPGVTGFLYAMSQTESQGVTGANGAFSGPPALFLPVPDRNGVWFLSVVSIDARSVPGTVAGRRAFRINTAPPTVTSSSHAKNVFTNKTDALFAWADPQEGGHWPSYRWILDGFGNTDPMRSNATSTVDRNLVVPGLANGLHVLHVVALDRNGDPTRVAAHYRFGVGATPTRGTITGAVRSAASGQLVGQATVSVNDGIESTSSLSNGSFTVRPYAGHWFVRVSKAGYSDKRVEVDVTASTTTSIDVALDAVP